MSTPERWRLILGRYAAGRLPLSGGPDGEQARIEAALEYLYGREYAGRGARPAGSGGEGGGSGGGGAGTLDDSRLTLVTWLGEVRELFPAETVEIVEKHALERYELTELLSDPETLEQLEPNEALLKTLITLRGHLAPAVLPLARRIITQVVEELKRRLEVEVRAAMAGRLNQQRHSPVRVAANFDPRDTIRRNLKNWDPETRRLVLEDVRFFERNTRRLPWEVVICLDQSGSMVDAVIHSAVMAGILAGLPSFRVRLVVFDTNVVDFTDRVDDPVEVLLSVQLGGGTDIAQAVRYCEQVIENPTRTVLVLITDFCEGAPGGELVQVVRRLAGARVRMIGLASLDGDGHASYDRAMAGRLADVGMHIAALTPGQLAQWLVEVTS